MLRSGSRVSSPPHPANSPPTTLVGLEGYGRSAKPTPVPNPDDRFPKVNLIQPCSTEWRKVISRLLEEPEYGARQMKAEGYDIDGHPNDDVLRLLGGMPHAFRERAVSQYRRGTRVFGKVPVVRGIVESDGTVSVTPKYAGFFRSIPCPEPPGEGKEFILAWLEGSFWRSDLATALDLGDGTRAPARSETGLGNDILPYFTPQGEQSLIRFLDQVSEDIRSINTESFPRPALLAAEQIHRILDNTGFAGTDRAKVARIFRGGMLYALEILYPFTIDHHHSAVMKTHGDWPCIIHDALARHGVETRKRDLLKKLGCLITDMPKKGSNAELSFEWQFTPLKPLVYSRFEDAYKVAKKDIAKAGDFQDSDAFEYLNEGILPNAQSRSNYHKRKEKEKENLKTGKEEIKLNMDLVRKAVRGTESQAGGS